MRIPAASRYVHLKWIRIAAIIILSLGEQACLSTDSGTLFQRNATNTQETAPQQFKSGISRSIAAPIGTQLGDGYSFIGGNFRAKAVVVNNNNTSIADENSIDYDVRYIDNYEQLAEYLRFDASASYSGMGGGASASYSIFQSTKLTSDHAYVLVRMTVLNGTRTLRKFAFTSQALQMLSNDGTRDYFRQRYGQAFVYRLSTGASLYAMLDFSKEQTETVQQMKAEISGSVGGFSASASTEHGLSDIIGSRHVRITYVQTGGAVGKQPDRPAPVSEADTTGGVLTMGVDELLGRIRDFPGEVRSKLGNEGAYEVYADVIDYGAVENLRDPSELHLDLDVVYFLQDLARVRMVLQQRLNDAEWSVAQFDAPDAKPTAETCDVGCYQNLEEYFRGAIREVDAIAQDCIQGSQEGCHGRFQWSNGQSNQTTRTIHSYKWYMDATHAESGTGSSACLITEPNTDLFVRCLIGSDVMAVLPMPLKAAPMTAYKILYWYAGDFGIHDWDIIPAAHYGCADRPIASAQVCNLAAAGGSATVLSVSVEASFSGDTCGYTLYVVACAITAVPPERAAHIALPHYPSLFRKVH